jgi:DNA-binding response OmpR family regulator
MHMRETNLVAFIDDIYSLFAQQAKNKNIQFFFDHSEEDVKVWIDRNNFDKIVINMLSNAFKFTPTGGEIRIRLTTNEKEATISIYDNGEKIPEDKLERIFERFYQSPSSANDRNIGTGIGLDLTRSLVELHHGSIEAHNNPDGAGCEFVVTIPLGNEHLKPEEMIDGQEQEVQPEEHLLGVVQDDGQITEEEPVVKSPNEKPTIVVVEDDDEIRNFLTEELQKDYEVKAFLHGKQALPEIYRIMPDIVLSDIMMPEMDGNALCTQLKMNPMTNHIPVILLTAKNRDEDKLEGLETGADAYIVKPFNMDILRRTIVNHINMSRLMKMKYGKRDQLEEQVEDVKMKSPDEKLLARVMATVNKHLNNSDLSVDMIAEEVGISRVHLHRKMKELTGQTPHDFIRSIRLKQAANLLSTRNMNITEVVYACGFSNAASFSTMFKNVYGMSPREYMRSQQKENKKKS